MRRCKPALTPKLRAGRLRSKPEKDDRSHLRSHLPERRSNMRGNVHHLHLSLSRHLSLLACRLPRQCISLLELNTNSHRSLPRGRAHHLSCSTAHGCAENKTLYHCLYTGAFHASHCWPFSSISCTSRRASEEDWVSKSQELKERLQMASAIIMCDLAHALLDVPYGNCCCCS